MYEVKLSVDVILEMYVMKLLVMNGFFVFDKLDVFIKEVVEGGISGV